MRLSVIHVQFTHANRRDTYKRARRVLKSLKTMAGRVFRDVERKMSDTAFEAHKGTMLLAEQILTQKRFTKGKIYSLHAPEVECIAKGKAHKGLTGNRYWKNSSPRTNCQYGFSIQRATTSSSENLKVC